MNAEALVAAMAELAGAVSEQIGPDDLLRRLVDVAAQHLAVDGVGVMIVEGGVVRFVHADRSEVAEAERLQQVMQEGPCRDAMLFQIDVIVDDLGDPVQTAWDDYVAVVRTVGFGSVVAVPLISRGRVWGCLDLYRRGVGTWTQPELDAMHLLAQVAVSYLVMAADRDEARRAQQELAHRSTHDALTGLPNRTLLFDRLEHALLVARRHERVVALFFIDLDRFKAINDTFGHAAGDTVLAASTTRMSAVLRAEDTLARLAGDEFVLVCEDLPQEEAGQLEDSIAVVTARLRAALAQPIRVGAIDVVVSASIGVAVSDGQLNADDLLADADAVMYRAKQHDFPDVLVGTGERRSTRRLERQLTQALAREQLQVHYQPIVDAAGDVHAVEALLRWQHPEHGLLSAGSFIDLAASSGVIVPIGQWVIHQTCAQMDSWRNALDGKAPACAYVNLSARELTDPALLTTLTSELREHDLQPQQVGLELLESSFVDAAVLPVLHELQRRGHPLSIDDFGTGYSSLSRLVELPVRTAKIDQSFVSGAGHDARRGALIDAVVRVAASLDLRVIAEGVETAAQAEHVRRAGCDYLQGFHCGHPQPGDTLIATWTS